MPKLTLIDMVQDILSDMDSDEVNSISDTVESYQVAQILKTAYYNIISMRDWPHLKELGQLVGLADVTKPNYLQIPDNVQKLDRLFYNRRSTSDTKDKYEEILYKEPLDFLNYINQRDSSSLVVDTITDDSNVELLILNDTAPTYWTSFDDEFIVFDSYDSDIDTTIQQSKNQTYWYKSASWTMSDTFIPDLPEKVFMYLQEEAKSTAFLSLKQVANEKAEQRSNRQRSWLAREKFKTGGGIKYPNYGRK